METTASFNSMHGFCVRFDLATLSPDDRAALLEMLLRSTFAKLEPSESRQAFVTAADLVLATARAAK